MNDQKDPIAPGDKIDNVSTTLVEEKKWYDILYKQFPAGKKLNPKIFLFGGFGLLIILGVIASTSSNKVKVAPSPTPTPAPTLSPSINQDNPLSQKTFINTKHNISFSHPGLSDECCYITGPMVGNIEAIGNLSDPATVQRGSDKPFDGISLFIINLGSLSPDEYMKLEVEALENQYLDNHGEKPRNSSWQTVAVDDQPTILLKNYSSLTINKYYIQFPKENKLLYIGANEMSLGSFDSTLNQILNSFSFETTPEQ